MYEDLCYNISVTVIVREEMLPKSTNRPLYYNINYCHQGRPSLKISVDFYTSSFQ